MDNPALPKLVPVPPKMQKRFGNGAMLVPSPREVDEVIRAVPEGAVITVSQIRRTLARKHSADVTCPLVTGIFVRIAAEAAEEGAGAGNAGITPYWRVLNDDGTLNPKFPGGVERQEERLRDEGHRIIRGNGKQPPRVALRDLAESDFSRIGDAVATPRRARRRISR